MSKTTINLYIEFECIVCDTPIKIEEITVGDPMRYYVTPCPECIDYEVALALKENND